MIHRLMPGSELPVARNRNRRGKMKGILWGVAWVFLWIAELHAAPSDPRFFGTYCGDAEIRHCVKVRVTFLGFTVDERTECKTLDLRNIRARLDHIETPRGGLITGRATATLEGDALGLVLAGAVVRRGLMRGSATVTGLKPYFGLAQLSDDGLRLNISAYNKNVTLRKDACGNNPPTVSIATSAVGAALKYGRTEFFRGDITDAEDVSFPIGRKVFTSNRDGILTGSTINFPKGLTLFTNDLSPGNHIITFSATDSGGLTASTSINVTVTNDNPDPPIIVQPLNTDFLVATGDIIFEGKSYDPEDGMLAGNSLVWRAKRSGEPFSILGFGPRLKSALSNPGTYTLRLTAVDSVGTESFTERTITIQPFAGNTPPRVTIEKPEHLQTRGTVAAALVAGKEIQFVGTAEDTEDPITALNLKWEAQATNPAGPATVFGTNSTEATTTLSALGGQTTTYNITFSATDSGGLVAKKTITIVILPSPIL